MRATQYLSAFVSRYTLCSSAKPWSCKFLSPWSHSSTALDTYLTLGTLATPLMSTGTLICLKLGMFSSVSTGSGTMGLRSLASVQTGFSWRSETSLSSVVDLSWRSNVYLQQPVARKGLQQIIPHPLSRPCCFSCKASALAIAVQNCSPEQLVELQPEVPALTPLVVFSHSPKAELIHCSPSRYLLYSVLCVNLNIYYIQKTWIIVFIKPKAKTLWLAMICCFYSSHLRSRMNLAIFNWKLFHFEWQRWRWKTCKNTWEYLEMLTGIPGLAFLHLHSQ